MKEKRQKELERLLPPGLDPQIEIGINIIIFILFVLWFWFVFFTHYAVMNENIGGKAGYMTMSHTLMWVMRNTLFGWVFVFARTIGCIRRYYRYFTEDSKSIYTMKRLKDKNEMHRRCLALPLILLAAAIVLGIGFVFIGKALYTGNLPKTVYPFDTMKFSFWRMIICLW